MAERTPRGWLVLAIEVWPGLVSGAVFLGYAARMAATGEWALTAVCAVAAAGFGGPAVVRIRRNIRNGYLASRIELLAAARRLPLGEDWRVPGSGVILQRVRLHVAGVPVETVTRGDLDDREIIEAFAAPFWAVRVTHTIVSASMPHDGGYAPVPPWWGQFRRRERTGLLHAESYEVSELAVQIKVAVPMPQEEQ